MCFLYTRRAFVPSHRGPRVAATICIASAVNGYAVEETGLVQPLLCRSKQLNEGTKIRTQEVGAESHGRFQVPDGCSLAAQTPGPSLCWFAGSPGQGLSLGSSCLGADASVLLRAPLP